MKTEIITLTESNEVCPKCGVHYLASGKETIRPWWHLWYKSSTDAECKVYCPQCGSQFFSFGKTFLQAKIKAESAIRVARIQKMLLR